MANIVLFRVNGKQVQPPWGAEWQKDDVFGVPVKSGCKAWKRYALKRKG